MSWTTPGDLTAQLSRLWERGDILRLLVVQAPQAPWRLRFKGPRSAELTERFEAVRAWVGLFADVPHIRIGWRPVRHPVLGAQRLPESAWVDHPEAAIARLGKRAEARVFAAMVAQTQARQPALLAWLARHPLRALALAERWARLLDVVDWMRRHPAPGCYLRQVDIPGIHSKFIESHRGVLAELFDLVLPQAAIDPAHGGAAGFAARYGFRDKPERVRMRVLDERLSFVPGAPRPDVSLDAESFAALELSGVRVFITENEANFLAFPAVTSAIVIFGAGYGWETLARAGWLHQCALHYWGDIDTHGFAILARLRARFPQVASFLMDEQTLLAHKSLWGHEQNQVGHDLPQLTAAESAVFNGLRDNRYGPGVRLEQEHVGFAWLTLALAALPA